MVDQSSEQQIKAGVDLARVRRAIEPALSAHGVSLVDVEWLTERAGWTLRVTIEREGTTDQGGGVTLEDCVDVSRAVSAILDADDDLIKPAYHLEVSSPGVDRPLKTPADFARFVGKTAKVKLAKPAPDGQRVLRGELVEAPEGKVAVIVDGKRIEAEYGDVTEAHLVFELAPQPKLKKGDKKKTGKGDASKKPAKSKR